MKKSFVPFFIILFVTCFQAKAGAQDKYPRLFTLDANALATNKNKLRSKDGTVTAAYKLLLKDAHAALKQGPFTVMDKKQVPPSGNRHDFMSLAPYHWPDSSKPNGLPYIRKDGQTNPEVKEYPDKEYMPKMIGFVETLAQAYYFSGDERYAKHATLLLKTWFLDTATKMNPNLNYAQAIKGLNEGRGAGMIDGRHFIKLIEAIGLIQRSGYWKKEYQQGMKNWFGEFLHWMQTSPNGIDESDAPNNHGTWYDALRLSLVLFTGDSSGAANKIIASVKQRLDQQMDGSGKFPKEMERTTSLHYSTFNLQAFFLVAAMAEHAGTDLWNYTSPKGNSIRKGFDFLKPYLANREKWPGQQIKPFDFEEDAYPVLMMAAAKLNCADCLESVAQLPGKKEAKMRSRLLY